MSDDDVVSTRTLARLLASAVACTAACVPAQRRPPPALAAPELALADLPDQCGPLNAFVGHVVLLEFFATWCKPCEAALQIVNDWQREYRADGLVILAVSVDARDAAVAEFAQRHAPDLMVRLDPDAVCAAHLGLRTLPATYLFNREGNLVSRHAGASPSSLRTEIDRLLMQP